jgi:hypothetical protein
MWNPPIALTPEEQKTAARTRKTRKFFVWLLLDSRVLFSPVGLQRSTHS